MQGVSPRSQRARSGTLAVQKPVLTAVRAGDAQRAKTRRDPTRYSRKTARMQTRMPSSNNNKRGHPVDNASRSVRGSTEKSSMKYEMNLILVGRRKNKSRPKPTHTSSSEKVSGIG